MKTTIVILSLLTTTLALAAPAAAECNATPTGGNVCASVQDASNFNVYADQPGVAAASADAYEFSFFGQTMRGKNVFVYTDPSGPAGYNSVSFSEFCFASGGACTFQDDSLFIASQHAGVVYASVMQGPEGATACAAASDQFLCTPALS